MLESIMPIAEPEKLKLIVDSVRAILCEVDLEGRIVWINKYGLEFFGYDEDEIIGKSVYDTIVPKLESTGRDLSGLLKGVLENGGELVPRINENVKKDGTRVWVYWSNRVLRNCEGRSTSIISTGIDITENVKLRKRLDFEHKRNASLIKLLDLIMNPRASVEEVANAVLNEAKELTESPLGVVATIDGKTGLLVGHTLRNIEGCTVKSCPISPDSDGKYPTLLGHAINTGKAFYTNSPKEHRSYRGPPEGHFPIKRILAVPLLIPYEYRRVSGVLALINSKRDYSDLDLENVSFLSNYLALALGRLLLEEKIRDSESFYRELFERSPIPMFHLSLDGTISLVNKNFEDLFGYSKNEIEGKKSWRDLVHPSELERLEGYWKRRTSGFKVPSNYETKALTKEGKILEVRIGIFKRKYGFTVSVVDLTGIRSVMRELEEKNVMLKSYANNLEKLVEERTARLLESERLSAIGEAALMVGHDLRNPLQALLNSTFLLENSIKGVSQEIGEEISKIINSMRQSISYMNKIVSDLQDFGRSFKVENTLVTIKHPIDLAIKDLKTDNVQLHVEAEDSKVILDPVLVSRALANLVKNAIEASPSGERVLISARVESCQDDLGRKDVEGKSRIDNCSVIYSVSDKGNGIPKEILENLFKPFKSTKAKGTGLGLVIVKRIVDSIGGTISVVSETGKGTTFTIRIPSKKPVLIS